MTADVGDLRVGRDALTLRELTTGKLRDAILSLRFKPGEHLVERVLCEQTGVSRSCLREALQHLESEGLIERRGGRGVFVASITVEEARQIYEVRAALEPEIGRLFSERATEDHINELFDSVEALSAAMAAHDIQGYVKALDRFYETLCAGSGNLVARRILHTLQGRMSYLRAVTTAKASQSRERETVQLMQEMAEAARRRDPVEVAHRCRAFVDRSAAFAIHVLSEKAVPESSPP
jgi:GntR family transcriptional regulator, trigonelline degradation regulator